MKPKSIKFAGMTIHEASRELMQQLKQVYDAREAAGIADLVMEHLTGWRKIDRAAHKDLPLSSDDAHRFDECLSALLAHKPVQYVLHEAWFYGMKFLVNEHVLIPRPETEELVKWVIDENQDSGRITVLDVGTGSGCISIALKKNLPGANIMACDISVEAIRTATENAHSLGVGIHFSTTDILDPASWDAFPGLDIIVSNPPYVTMQEKAAMHPHVVDYEPHLALFVADDDPFVFYRAIARLGKKKLSAGGKIYVEINENLAGAIPGVFYSEGYHSVETRKDMQGKDRMVRAFV